jgi:hypothetical protein
MEAPVVEVSGNVVANGGAGAGDAHFPPLEKMAASTPRARSAASDVASAATAAMGAQATRLMAESGDRSRLANDPAPHHVGAHIEVSQPRHQFLVEIGFGATSGALCT